MGSAGAFVVYGSVQDRITVVRVYKLATSFRSNVLAGAVSAKNLWFIGILQLAP